MRLLVCTQIVDRPDATLGFFHRWLEIFSKHFESITVICLKRGECHLPDNVRVFSLGKEEGRSRLKYLKRFYQYSWRERRRYDAVLVHMNQEYVLLGAPFWRLLGKPVYMWRNHYAGSIFTDIAAWWCKRVFCTSHYSYTAKYSKTVIMPVGFDTELLAKMPVVPRVPCSVLSLGRVSPSKNIHLLIEALGLLHHEGVEFTADIYGASLPEDMKYREGLAARAEELDLDDKVSFYPAVPNTETPRLYAGHEIFVNASLSGMLDKTIFSAMGRGCLVLVSNCDLKGKIPPTLLFEEGSAQDLARGLRSILTLAPAEKERLSQLLQEFVFTHHSLASLADKLFEYLNQVQPAYEYP